MGRPRATDATEDMEEKTKGSKRKVEEEEGEVNETKKRGRPKKTQEVKQEEEETPEVKRRGRPKKVAEEEEEVKESKKRGRPKKEEVKEEQEENIEPGKTKEVKQDEEEATETKKRGRSKKVKEEPIELEDQEEEAPKKRGRPKRSEKQQEVKEEPIELEDEEEEAPKKRGRPKKTERAEETKEEPKRGKRKIKEEPAEPSTSREADVEEEAEKKIPGGSKTKGRKKKTKSEEEKENTDTLNVPAKSGVKSGVERVVVVKGRAAVDAVCPAAATSHVYEDADDVWDCMLNQTNIEFNNNKFYLIQLLESDQGGAFSVWMRWGRVGANGQNALHPCGPNLDKAKAIFTKKFSDKTRNEWSERHDFEKVKGKYDMLAMDYSQDQTDGKLEEAKTKARDLECQLEARLKTLIELICSLRVMEAAVVEMKYDAKKAPLGKLTTDQIRAGYLALREIDEMVREGNVKNSKLLHACNDFYTRIPHYFGMRVPPLIRTLSDIQEKMALLDALGDIQAALSVLGQPADLDVHPADQHYLRLQCEIQAVDKGHQEFKIIERYMQTTHGKTHTGYSLELIDLFRCRKELEYSRFKNLGNSMLLWHGSRLSNWAGILSQGLRIAPPEAPSTGYMFGKGIYFADMASKSANYCWASERSDVGILLLSEVSLGKSNELLAADYNADKMPKGCASVKGLGKYSPQPANYEKLSDGLVVPMGPAADTQTNNPGGYTLLYNEYIVYDPAQVRARYLLKVKFNFKR